MKRTISIILSVMLFLSTLSPLQAGAVKHGSRFYATYLQNWLCRDWTEARWEQEFQAAKEAGFQAIILQSTCDIVRGEAVAGGDAQDPSSYPDTAGFCMFPSENGELSGAFRSSQNQGDALELALTAAKQTEMQLWLGTANDDLWWKYGWGLPHNHGDSTYFEEWSKDNAALSASLIEEIWKRYGEDYSEQIGGFYYVNEIWNMDAACMGTDHSLYASVIGSNLHIVIQALECTCPEKSLLISPFYNPEISTSKQYTAFLTDILETAQLRPIDIYAGQDGGGSEYSPEVIREWTLAQKQAVSDRMHFWANCETFQKNLTPKPVEQLRKNYAATADLAEQAILFSWNHYYHDSDLNTEFIALALETQQGDVNGDGIVSVADAVMLQKWLHCKENLDNPDAADMDDDGQIDVFDLALLKRKLVGMMR